MGPETPVTAYTTLGGDGEAEIRVERSRFLATARPVADASAARALVAAIARVHHDARHVCWACRLGHGAQATELRSDAGEPSGTAGEPILGVLRHAGITDAAIVVVRWFGGVKLGTGGLGRAYRDAAAAALAAAPQLVVPLGVRLRLAFPYDLLGRVEHLLGNCGGRLDAAEFDAGVAWTVWLPAARGDEFARELAAIGQGRIRNEHVSG
ncbi:MAG: YigZ family protein [bacterium]|nr:YigZ family protein [bacterium]